VSALELVLRAAQDAGVELALLGGALTVKGSRRALAEHGPRLRAFKAELIDRFAANDPAKPPPPAPEPDPSDWRALHREYERHARSCVTCVSAGRGYGLRCGTGAATWLAYQGAG